MLAAAAAFVIAVVSAGIVFALWSRQSELAAAVQSAERAAAAALERTEAERRSLAERLAELDTGLGNVQGALGELRGLAAEQRAGAEQLRQRLEPVPARLAALEQRIDTAQAGTLEARARWLRAEAEHYLTLANAELALAGQWETATRALEIADERLRQLADPAYARVRELIAEELLALRGVRLPDIEGLVFTLGRLAARVDELPVRGELPAELTPPDPEPLDEVEPGLGRLWVSFKQAMGGIVRIERRDEPMAPMLRADERELVRRRVSIALDQAQIAAIRGEAAAYASSLRRARELLLREFDADAPAVEGALALIGELLELEVAPPRPDISGSLNRLRALSGSD